MTSGTLAIYTETGQLAVPIRPRMVTRKSEEVLRLEGATPLPPGLATATPGGGRAERHGRCGAPWSWRGSPGCRYRAWRRKGLYGMERPNTLLSTWYARKDLHTAPSGG